MNGLDRNEVTNNWRKEITFVACVNLCLTAKLLIRKAKREALGCVAVSLEVL